MCVFGGQSSIFKCPRCCLHRMLKRLTLISALEELSSGTVHDTVRREEQGCIVVRSLDKIPKLEMHGSEIDAIFQTDMMPS